MRICLYTETALPTIGGQELAVDALARQFRAYGHEVVVLTLRGRRGRTSMIVRWVIPWCGIRGSSRSGFCSGTIAGIWKPSIASMHSTCCTVTTSIRPDTWRHCGQRPRACRLS